MDNSYRFIVDLGDDNDTDSTNKTNCELPLEFHNIGDNLLSLDDDEKDDVLNEEELGNIDDSGDSKIYKNSKDIGELKEILIKHIQHNSSENLNNDILVDTNTDNLKENIENTSTVSIDLTVPSSNETLKLVQNAENMNNLEGGLKNISLTDSNCENTPQETSDNKTNEKSDVKIIDSENKINAELSQNMNIPSQEQNISLELLNESSDNKSESKYLADNAKNLNKNTLLASSKKTTSGKEKSLDKINQETSIDSGDSQQHRSSPVNLDTLNEFNSYNYWYISPPELPVDPLLAGHKNGNPEEIALLPVSLYLNYVYKFP